MRCARNVFIKCHKCSGLGQRMRCPFNCKLSCAHFGLSTPAINAPGASNSMAIAYGLAGAKEATNTRIMRLCMSGGSAAIRRPRGRLGNFQGMCLRPNRAGDVRVAIPTRTFSRCSANDQEFIVSQNDRSVLLKFSSQSVGTGVSIKVSHWGDLGLDQAYLHSSRGMFGLRCYWGPGPVGLGRVPLLLLMLAYYPTYRGGGTSTAGRVPSRTACAGPLLTMKTRP